MLTEQRFDIILKLLEEKKSVTVTELRELLDASESTVRRDITALDKAGKLTKVFGGAVALNHKVTAYEPTVAQKSELNKEEKQKIAKYAASLITPDDFVYLDAGTTTGLMLDYLEGVKEFPKQLSQNMTLTFNSKEYSGTEDIMLFLVANSKSVGGFADAAPLASVDDHNI